MEENKAIEAGTQLEESRDNFEKLHGLWVWSCNQCSTLDRAFFGELETVSLGYYHVPISELCCYLGYRQVSEVSLMRA